MDRYDHNIAAAGAVDREFVYIEGLGNLFLAVTITIATPITISTTITITTISLSLSLSRILCSPRCALRASWEGGFFVPGGCVFRPAVLHVLV